MRTRAFVLAALLLSSGVACGDDSADGTPPPGSESAACDQDRLDSFIDAFHEQGLDLDYSGSSSPGDLAMQSEIVLRGVVTALVEHPTATPDNLATIAMLIAGPEVQAGPAAELPDPVPVLTHVSAADLDELAETFEANANGLFFLENLGSSSSPEWHSLPEGTWLACGSAPPRSLIANPRWTVSSWGEILSWNASTN